VNQATKDDDVRVPLGSVPTDHLVVCLPDNEQRDLMGEFPGHVEVVLIPPDPGPIPDLSGVDLIVPSQRVRRAVIDALGRPGHLRVIQTLGAGVDWLAGLQRPGRL